MRQLTFEEIRPLLHGAQELREQEGTLAAERFTAAQRAFYASVKPAFVPKTHATAAMRLEFDTDATAVTFSFVLFRGSSRSYCNFDVSVDGALLLTPAVTDAADGTEISFTLTESLDGGVHRVRVYLPNLWAARIRGVAVSDGARVLPVQKSCKLLCVGGSITQGYDAYCPSGTYVNLVADDLDAEVVSYAIGGDIFRPEALDPAAPFVPDTVIVAYGFNDWSRPSREEVVRDVRAYYARMREIYPAATLFALTPIWCDKPDAVKPNGMMLADVAKIIREAGEAVGAHVIDGMPLVPNLVEYYYDARIHPNDAGFAHYARNLLRAMRPYL